MLVILGVINKLDLTFSRETHSQTEGDYTHKHAHAYTHRAGVKKNKHINVVQVGELEAEMKGIYPEYFILI